jgi:uncharacterized DUF497 family protein
VEFEWNVEKSERNRQKHSVGFDEAMTVFADAWARFADDREHSRDEQRFSVLDQRSAGNADRTTTL